MEFEEVRMAVSQSIANRGVPDELVDKMSGWIVESELPVRDIDVCTHGICFDYFFDPGEWIERMPHVVRADLGRLRNVEVIPHGIPWPDLFQVRVTRQLEGMPRMG